MASDKLHASGEDHLETIFVLKMKKGMVRSIDVALQMEVTKASVSRSVSLLRQGGFLRMDADHFLHLTDAGREIAEKIYERHCFFKRQLMDAGVAPEMADKDACRMEHTVSQESFLQLKKFYAESHTM